ncbi:hypothetical protein TBLA_0B05990 [Henningerozyma blattae CBS 6284]|uniref:RNA polymerase II holoenzyme cyclin-like subunit n=1 Tax=Henningerozyma blattae (strain ATCC 34711 / CBS 6284 / DSM 70876 / NBRC 10599 / NRRL Y-10934 / UCD 77-7) TaxID=1071380 RepID=I2GZ73_HENB6|nr:hypothetical protein TBLA_0B05990 [Tetrapisispora blattae CBS 6284]CCH59425.1 hypothetical protein TBLA_0B05990 [Tetrapisispora blattae CBS 6284]
MSGSYWTSTQRSKWQFTRQSLARERACLWNTELQQYPNGLNVIMDTPSKRDNNNNTTNSNGHQIYAKNIPIAARDLHWSKDYNLRIYSYFLIMKLGRRLNIRQCALATAQIYMARFLLKVSVREINLFLLVTTCVYLSCKVEECPQYIRTLVSEARSLWPEYIPPDPTKVTEFEFYLIEELDSYLIVHHPYNSMEEIIKCLKQEPYNLKLNNEDIQNCWSLINDSYIINEVHLLYSPHIIAVSCLFITICLRNVKSINNYNNMNSGVNEDSRNNTNSNMEINKKKQEIFNRFLAESQINLEEVMDTIQQTITLYEHWESYQEVWIKFLLHALYLRNPTKMN